MRPRRVRALGVEFDLIAAEAIVEAIELSITEGHQIVIANHNLHSAYLARKHEELTKITALAELVHADGMPLVWTARLLGHEANICHRVTYLDLGPMILEAASSKDWRVFYLGSRPGVAERGSTLLRQTWASLQIQVHHGYFDPDGEQNEDVLGRINAFKPHVLMVGLGMPKQEAWILNNKDRVSANALLSSGAYMDYVAGVVPAPPRWLGRAGLEWLFRLISEPRRLGFRYLIEPWFLIPEFARDILRKLGGT